jgi:signal transduction histidine kinase
MEGLMTATGDAPAPGLLRGPRAGADGATRERSVEEADDRVRRELARELHDQVVQELTATLIDLENFKRQPFDEERVAVQVDQVQGSLRRTLRELRELLYDLRDEEAWQPSFMSTLRETARGYGERTGMRVSVAVDGDWPSRVRAAPAKHLQRIILEAVTNARLHGGARSVWVSLLAEADQARVTILDDGRGMDPDSMGSGMGILGMRERAALLGGSVSVEPAPRQGTLVRLQFPRATLA